MSHKRWSGAPDSGDATPALHQCDGGGSQAGKGPVCRGDNTTSTRTHLSPGVMRSHLCLGTIYLPMRGQQFPQKEGAVDSLNSDRVESLGSDRWRDERQGNELGSSNNSPGTMMRRAVAPNRNQEEGKAEAPFWKWSWRDLERPLPSLCGFPIAAHRGGQQQPTLPAGSFGPAFTGICPWGCIWLQEDSFVSFWSRGRYCC